MKSGFMGAQVARVRRNLLFWNGLIIALLLALLAFGAIYYLNLLPQLLPRAAAGG